MARTSSISPLHNQVVVTLGRRVIGGELKPGDILDLEALAGELSVSRTVLREALRVLADKGLIGARTKVGTYVEAEGAWNLLDPDVLTWELDTALDERVFEQFGEMRSLIEPGAAALAAMRRTDEQLAELRVALATMASSGHAPDRIAAADVLFHRTVFAASGNPLVQRQGLLIEIGLRARDTFVHEHHVSIQRGLAGHIAVADAIETHDPDAAASAMRTLIADATEDARQVAVPRPDRTQTAG